MHKNGFTITEVIIVFLLILGMMFFILPMNIQNTRQAKLISRWSDKYNELEYMFSVMMAQKTPDATGLFSSIKNDGNEAQSVLNSIKSYMRVTSEVKEPYVQHYMDKKPSDTVNTYHFDKFYFTSGNEIVGLKLINPHCKENDICAVISLDINGTKSPNTWGYDIFGINLLDNKIEPLGKGIESDVLRDNCSKHGSGIYCSYYYLIGGRFD